MKQTLGDCENVLDWFKQYMLRKLQLNLHKEHWLEVDSDYLMKRLDDEITELKEALAGEDGQAVVLECADVANIAMMIADNKSTQMILDNQVT